MELGPIDYSKGAPAGYRCAECGATGLKLWRSDLTLRLLCARCACDALGVPFEVNDEGKLPFRYEGKIFDWSDQIKTFMPAVPTPDGETFWGYTSAPKDAVDWWKRLPTRPPRFKAWEDLIPREPTPDTGVKKLARGQVWATRFTSQVGSTTVSDIGAVFRVEGEPDADGVVAATLLAATGDLVFEGSLNEGSTAMRHAVLVAPEKLLGIGLGLVVKGEDRGYPWLLEKPSRFVVASDGHDGVVVYSVGHASDEIREICSSILSDLGLDDAPKGVSVWEGKLYAWESGNPLDGVEYNTELKGTFRQLLPAEALAVARGEAPWREKDWLAPGAKAPEEGSE